MTAEAHIPRTAEEAKAAERREPIDPRPAMHARVDSDFKYHPPKPGQPVRYEQIRESARVLAHTIVELVPPGREQSTALTRLEEAVMHANAGIARVG